MSLFNNLNKFGRKKAIVFKNTEITYSELENFYKKNNILSKNSLVLLSKMIVVQSKSYFSLGCHLFCGVQCEKSFVLLSKTAVVQSK